MGERGTPAGRAGGTPAATDAGGNARTRSLLYLTEERISFSGTEVRGGAIHVRKVVCGLRERGDEVSLLDWNPAPERPFQVSVAPRTRFVDGPARTFLRAVTVAATEDVDAVVSKTRKTYLPGLLAARRAGVPHVVHVGSTLGSSGSGLRPRVDAASLSARLRAPHDAYFVVCRAVADQLRDRGVRASRLYDVKNAVDAGRFHPERRPTLPDALRRAVADADAPFLVGFVGGLQPYKGLGDLATALPRCSADVAAVIAGDGPERDALEAAFGDRAAFTGALPYACVPAVYHAVDAFVLPSYTEGLPRVVLEAQATGTPVVATRVGGVPEAVEDEKTGLLVDPGDPDALARAIDRLAGDEDLRRRLGAGGRRAVAGSFSWDAMFERYDRYLDDVLGR